MIGSNKQTGNSRSKMLFKNIALSALFKAVGLLCSLLIVPVTLDYLDNEIYGVWLTLTSILYWFTFFDVGLGNGMRNYLTQAISKGDYLSAKSCISTTLSLLLLISAIIATIVLIAVCLFDLTAVFNISAISDTELKKCVAIAVVFTFINFVVKNVGYIFIALQKYAVNDFLSISGSVLSLVAVFILTKTTESNLLYVVSAFTGIPVAVYILSSIPIFHKYPQFKPSWKAIDKAMGRKITGKGIGFFVIQITSCHRQHYSHDLQPVAQKQHNDDIYCGDNYGCDDLYPYFVQPV